MKIALFGTIGHLRKQVRHSLIHQVGHIKVHHASLDTRTGKPPYCFPSYTLQKDHSDKTPSNREYFVSFNKRGYPKIMCPNMI